MATFTLPGATSLSEWSTVLNGAIATCVETSETVMLGMLKAVPVSPQLDQALTADLQARGQAKANGATWYGPAADQLTRLGVPNTIYDKSGGASSADLIGVLQSAVQHTPVLVGVPNASPLQDAVTGQFYNAGVGGHGLTAVGLDSGRNAIVFADPNTPQAQTGQFVEYTPQSLANAGIDSLIVPKQQLLGGPGSASTQSQSQASPLAALTGVPFLSSFFNGQQQVQSPAITSPVNVVLQVPASLGTAIGQGVGSGLLASAGIAPSRGQPIGFGALTGRVLFIVAGLMVLGVGLAVLFFGGNVGGASPAQHTARGIHTTVRTGAAVAAVAG